MKTFVDDKLNFDKMTISLLDKVENTEEEGENDGYQHFLLFPQCFLKSQQRPTRQVFVYKIQVNPIHTILKYGNYYDFMGRKWCSS